ncbi:tetratricopeptide repeat protein [Marinobacter nauticus]|uniref:tetratricopeptide repeat protein n=1 Tax=Marinobacter nauticus TaxID=2743 RepID=UPI001C9A090B|nr:hypothetical protein [Marinobacter nauticus]MBY5937713.1 hypothetical protein [Marinobacter nauticus]MBY5954941.1 hypothetical protein [Marinobacter nauticus]MBY6008734.1 hypothetical protein [Marinobacter nauticus]
MFDDFPNLEPLGYWGSVDSLDRFVNFVGSGFSGPTGRPVALASFLLDANTWPAEPYAFKRTSVLFHLLTGCGVFLFLLRFLDQVKLNSAMPSRSALACLCVTALWLFHPYWVSTSLYVIQRMAILSALFGVFSLWGYLGARSEVMSSGYFNGKAVAWTLMAGVFFVAGVYSKENILILPVCVLVIEFSLHSRAPVKSRVWHGLVVFCVVIPSVLLLGYLVQRGASGWDVVDGRRGFSIGDRLLAQGRILWQYLFEIVVPRPYTGGLYTPADAPSVGLVRWLGLLGWLGFLGLIIVTWRWRKKWPLLFPGITLFVVGHLIESTVIPLELYFEHRNYFPGIFLALIPLQLAFSDQVSRWMLRVFSVTAIVVLSSLLWMRASLWADYPALVTSWAERSPQSVRAQLETSKLALQSGDGPKAITFYSRAREAGPDDLRVDLWGVFVNCALGGGISEEFANVLSQKLASAPDSGGILQYLAVLVEQGSDFDCSGLAASRIAGWLKAYQGSPRTGQKTDNRLYMLLGVNAVTNGKPEQALVYFRLGIWGLGSVNAGMLAVSNLASAEYVDEARVLLEEVSMAHAGGQLVGEDVNYDYEIKRLRDMLRHD